MSTVIKCNIVDINNWNGCQCKLPSRNKLSFHPKWGIKKNLTTKKYIDNNMLSNMVKESVI